MQNEFTNLLPSKRQSALSRDYFVRLAVVGTVLFSILTLASTVLLIPTYVFLANSVGAKEARLAHIKSALSSEGESTLTARLTALSGNAAILTALAHAPSASDGIRAVLAVARPGITLFDFSYTPAFGTNTGTIVISGRALTRDALRKYQLALSSAPFARSADLPVSAYAKDSDIAFTITVTLAP